MNWKYEGQRTGFGGVKRHVWSREHREGYTAYQITHSKSEPTGTGHYVEKEGLLKKTGIEL